MSIKKIIVLIEQLRKELHMLGQVKGFNDEEVLQKSRELDELLNKYHKLMKKAKKP